MLSARGSSLLKGDVAGYLKTVAAAAQPAERPLVEGAKGVPLSSAEFVPRDRIEREPGPRVAGFQIELVYRYKDLPEDNTFHVPLKYDLSRVTNGWQITSSALQDGAHWPVWATGPVLTSRSQHFLAVFRPTLTTSAATLNLAERARTTLESKLTIPLEKSHVMLLAQDRSQYLEMSSRESPPAAIAHFESTYSITSDSIKADGRQIIVNLAQLKDDETSIETFQHELGHLSLSRDTRPFTPAWVTESAAMYLAGSQPMLTWQQGIRKRKFDGISFTVLSRASSLGAPDATGIAGSYEYAYAAAAAYYLIQDFGAEKYWNFYKSFAEISPDKVYERVSGQANRDAAIAALAEDTARDAVLKSFGLTLGDLDLRVRSWIGARVQ